MAIQDEIERLRQEWLEAGGDVNEFNAWRQGATREEHLEELRRRLDELRGARRSEDG